MQPMKTVTEIVQRLLDERHITAEEAIVLLQAEVNRNQPFYIPNTLPSMPTIQPYSPPYKPGDLWYTTSSTGTNTVKTTGDMENKLRTNPEEGD